MRKLIIALGLVGWVATQLGAQASSYTQLLQQLNLSSQKGIRTTVSRPKDGEWAKFRIMERASTSDLLAEYNITDGQSKLVRVITPEKQYDLIDQQLRSGTFYWGARVREFGLFGLLPTSSQLAGNRFAYLRESSLNGVACDVYAINGETEVETRLIYINKSTQKVQEVEVLTGCNIEYRYQVEYLTNIKIEEPKNLKAPEPSSDGPFGFNGDFPMVGAVEERSSRPTPMKSGAFFAGNQANDLGLYLAEQFKFYDLAVPADHANKLTVNFVVGNVGYISDIKMEPMLNDCREAEIMWHLYNSARDWQFSAPCPTDRCEYPVQMTIDFEQLKKWKRNANEPTGISIVK
jgi:hypothetical protein